MTRKVVAAFFFASSMLFGFVHAEDSETTAKPVAARSDESPAKTIVYIARNSPANSLSAAIAVFLEGTDSRVVADVMSNVLLVHTSEEHQQRVIAVLQQLDRAPRTIRVQLHLLKARGESLAEVDAASLTGQTDEVLNSIKALESMQRVHVANRIELTVVENQPSFLQVGENVPLRTGTATTNRGVESRYSNASVGTMFKVESRLSGESDIVLVVDFEKSEVSPPVGNTDEESQPIPQGISQMTHQATSRIHDGHSLLVGTLVSQATDGAGEAYLVLSASIDNSQHPTQVAKLQSSSPPPASKADSGPTQLGSEAKGVDPRYLAYYEKLLAKYDLNKDKALDAEERGKMSKDCSEADTDKNGLVSLEELAIWSMKR